MTETRVCNRCGQLLPLTREFFAGNGHDRCGNQVLKYHCRSCRLDKPRPKRKPQEPEEHCIGRRLPPLPAAPILAKLMEHGVQNIDLLCKQLGFAERTLLAWRVGERRRVRFDTVDKILTRAGWLWFDVYNKETVLLPDGTTDWETLRRVEHDFTCEGCEECEKKAEKHVRDQELKMLRGEVAA